MSELLERAFAALGPGPTYRELRLVAETLREADDEETTALLEDADAIDKVQDIAVEQGAGAFTALDLVCAFANPDYCPRMSGPLPQP